MKSDVVATTHAERKAPKVVDHIEIHPTMNAGHRVEIHHTHSYDHPPIVKQFEGPHEAVSLPKGHVLAHIGKQLGMESSDQGAAANKEEGEIRGSEGAGTGTKPSLATRE